MHVCRRVSMCARVRVRVHAYIEECRRHAAPAQVLIDHLLTEPRAAAMLIGLETKRILRSSCQWKDSNAGPCPLHVPTGARRGEARRSEEAGRGGAWRSEEAGRGGARVRGG